MEIKKRHRNIIEKKLHGFFDTFQIEAVKKFPKSIKFHVHITDGFFSRCYLYKVECQKGDQEKITLYCQLSPIILLLYFNVTFWTIGEKWMNQYRLN